MVTIATSQNTEHYKNQYGWTATVEQVFNGYLLTVTDQHGQIIRRYRSYMDRTYIDHYLNWMFRRGRDLAE